ncbi:uncharacterized protein [Amphiura filiformis]|uniref:uncharacterized protein n=1 Tax=Amphiura filiformis TaxID=82378 RepID=UPI003B20FB03
MASTSTLLNVQKTVLLLNKTTDYTTEEASEALSFLYSIFWTDHNRIAKEATKHGIGKLFVKISRSMLTRKSEDFRTLVSIFWNYTDGCPELGCDLGRNGAIGYIISLLDGSAPEKLKNKSTRVLFGLLSILHNSIRHDACAENRSIYRQAGAVELLKKWVHSSEMVLKVESLLVLAYITNEAQSELLGKDNDAVKFLVDMLQKAVKSRDHNVSVRSSTFSASEILKGLSHLVLNDSNKKVVFKSGGVTTINRMLKSDFTAEEQCLAAGTLWKLAFDDTVKQSDEIKESLRGLKPLTTSDNHDLRTTSRSAIWQITAQPSEDKHTGKKQEGQHIMISYNWTHQKLALALRDELERADYRIWIDVDKMQDDILEAMAKAVNNSAAVLICMSQQYYESQSCRSEATYAYKKQKHVIPLLMEDNYKAEGWLDFLIGTKLYYKMCSESQIRKNITDVIKAIGGRGKGTDDVDGPVSAQHAETTEAAPPATESSVSSWSTERVQVWFEEIKLPQLKASLDFFEGKDVESLYKDSCNDKSNAYRKMCEECGLKEIETRRLTTALRKLFV